MLIEILQAYRPERNNDFVPDSKFWRVAWVIIGFVFFSLLLLVFLTFKGTI